ncbi:acyl-CoA synthetase [Siccirubricoccus deserti]|uniref:AMP-binding protein n=1 Tax=Siccirubricoccus deserti TaxID=2013562 RepID=A0A9X0UFE9_9PROT|nr:acyl-CoA synthetase [Siccirubricoccus deserti]MBC4017788.1 AMP-binding protein [Siccirubricoccus deserti]GGC61430.1 acyl-CoA synthetase [Siccirubricoccus deserti]
MGPATAMNLGRLLTQTARRLPDHLALVWGERRWSWAELDRRVDRLVAVLAGAGIGKGDRVMVHARNSNAMFESMWATFKLGAVWVPTNFRLTPAEVAGLAETARPRALLRDRGFAAHADAVRATGHAPFVLAVGDAREGEQDYEAALAAAAPPPPDHEAPVAYDDPIWFFFTSGTTGRPKAAVLTHGQLAFCVNNQLADLYPGTTEASASLVVAPLSHGAGIHQLGQVARGARSVLLPTERLDAEEAWRLVEEHRIDNIFTVPTILKALVEHPAVDRTDHSSLRHVIYAGAPMYRADQILALQKLGPCLVQYFGLGEVTGNITVLRPDQHSLAEDAGGIPIGSCGSARTGMEIAILDDAGQRLPPGETGEICVRGAAVFAGYFENPEANEKAFRGGWFHTGDLGTLDARGFLSITGRASDMYISGGSNVYPREVEEAILTHPAVLECAVVGLPHPRWGEAGVAAVVPRDGATLDEAAVLRHLADRIARYKQPLRVVLWEALPKSGYGKIPKALVQQRLRDDGVSFT